MEENRNHITRNLCTDTAKILREIKGEAYSLYRREYEAAVQHRVKPAAPLQLNVALTDRCNIKCSFCYRNFISQNDVLSPPPPRNDMTLSTADMTVRRAKEANIRSLVLGANAEGLLHPHAETIIKKFGEVGAMDYWFITNGTLLTEKITNTMIDSGVTLISVSQDAATPETYKAVRGGDLDIVRRNVHNFLELRNKQNSKLPFLRVTFVENPLYIHEKEAFLNEWQDKADIIDFQKFIQMNTDKLNENVSEKFICSDPWRLIGVDCDGELKPCCRAGYIEKNPVYLQDMSLLDYWDGARHTELERDIIKGRYKGHCVTCMKGQSF